MSEIKFAEDAWEEYLYWQATDRKTLARINGLLKEIQRTPFTGTGKPEPLRGIPGNKWSRRINSKDRLVYEYEDGIVTVQQCRGHYEDT